MSGRAVAKRDAQSRRGGRFEPRRRSFTAGLRYGGTGFQGHLYKWR